MLENRVIPCLQLYNNCLVKTTNFDKPQYIGDPLNTCRIFNELEVDEMVIVDIRSTVNDKNPNYKLLEKMTCECFMPLTYGGGIKTFEHAANIFKIGFEKVIINSAAYDNYKLIYDISNVYGAQSIILGVDYRKTVFKGIQLFSKSGTVKEKIDIISHMERAIENGAGEVLLTNIDREGTWKGFDIENIKTICASVDVPVIVHGGAGSDEDVEAAVNVGGASAVALGNMVVYQKKGMGVLVNYHHDYTFKNV